MALAANILNRHDDYSIREFLEPDGIYSELIKEHNVTFTLCLSIGTVFFLALLFLNFRKLDAFADNERRRQRAIEGIIGSSVCLAVIGGFDILYAMEVRAIFGG